MHDRLKNPVRRPRKTRYAALATAAIAAGLFGATATSAAAAPISSQYDNTDPATTGCSANSTTYWGKNLVNPATGAVTGYIELRYSRSCQTNWVRINNNVAGATAQKDIVRPRQDGPNGKLEYNSDTTRDTVNGVSYGKQLYAPAGICVLVGGTLTLNGQVVGSSGQSMTQVC